MKFSRSFQAALVGATLAASAFAQTEADLGSLRTKAQRGNAVAQYNLGLAYLEGRGTAADPVEAYIWLSLARESGARGRALDNLIATLDNPTLETARQRLTERRATLGLRAPAGNGAAAVSPAADGEPASGPLPPPGGASPETASAPAPDAAAALQRQLSEALSDKRALSNEVSSAWKEVDALKARLATATAEAERVKKEATAAVTDKQQLSAEVASAWKEVDALKAQLAIAQASLAALEAKAATTNPALEQQTRMLQTTAAELDEARKGNDQLTAALTKAGEERAGLEQQLQSTRAAAQEAGQRVTELETRLTATQTAAEQARQEAAAARQALAAQPAAPGYPDLRERVNGLETQLAAAGQKAATDGEQLAALATRVRLLEQDNAHLSSQVDERSRKLVAQAQAETELAQKQLAEAVAARTALQGQIAALETRLAAAAQQPPAPAYPDLRDQVARLESQVAELKKPVAPAYPDLSGRVQELEGSLLTASRQADESGAAARTAADRLQAATQQLAELTRALAANQAELAAQQAQAGEWKTKFETLAAQPPAYPDLRGRVGELEMQLAAVQQAAQAQQNATPAYPDLSGRVHELETAVTKLTAKVADAEQARTQAQAELEKHSDTFHAAERERTTLLAQNKMLESDKASFRRQLDSAAAEATQLRTQLAALKGQLAERSAAPAYPDLRDQVARLETALATTQQTLAAAQQAALEKPAAPAYPDLSGRVAELETQLADSRRALAEKPAAPAYPDLSGRVQELEGSLAAAGTRVAELNTLANEHTKLVADLQAELQKTHEKLTTQPVYPDLRERVGELETQLAAASAGAARANQEAEAARQALAARPAAPSYPDLSGRVAELETQLADTSKALAQQPAAPAYPDLRGRVGELEMQLAAAQQAAQQNATPAYPDLSGRVRELETQLNDMAGRAGSLETKLFAVTTAKAGVDSEFQTLRLQLNRAQQESADALAAADKLRTDYRTLQARLESAPQAATPAYPDLRERVGELEAQVAALRDAPPAFPDLRGRVGELEQQLAATQQAAQSAAQQNAAPAYPDLSGRVQELESALAAHSAQATASEAARRQLAQQFDDYKSSTLAAQREHVSLQSQVQMLESDKASLRRQVSTSDAEAAQLRAQVAALKSQAANAGAAPAYPDLRERVGELEAQVAALRDAPPAFPDLRGRVSELEQQLAAATAAPAQAAAPAYPDLRDRVGELEAQVSALRTAAPAYPDLRGRVGELEMQLAAARQAAEEKPATPGYPDLRERVAQLETALREAQPAAPAYPDLRNRVAELEQRLAAAPSAPAYPDLRGRVSELELQLAAVQQAATQVADASTAGLQQRLADTEDKLATALRGYALLEKERDELTARAEKSSADLSADRNSLAARLAGIEAKAAAAEADVARLTEQVGALQRASVPVERDLAATRALLEQMRGANTVLAQENYQLKSRLAGAPAASATLPTVRTHTVAAGDSLSKISQRYYGSTARWPDIYNANREVISPEGVLRVGSTLRIP